MTRYITLCADDYGLHSAINYGILTLVQRGRLSSVSCMSQCRLWPDAAQRLATHHDQVAVGLHFNLTEGLAETDQPLWKLILHGLMRRIDRRSLACSLRQQLDLFETHWQAPPDHVDGHQHVHALPGIRDTLLAVLKDRYAGCLPSLRDPAALVPATDAPLKNLLLRKLCSRFQAQATERGFRLNSAFAGAYSLSEKADFARLFAAWMHCLPDGGLIMCHPARGADSFQPCAHLAARNREFDYLASDKFPDLLQCVDARLMRAKPEA